MENDIFKQIMDLNYEDINIDKRIELLQYLENYASKIYNRNPRKLVYHPDYKVQQMQSRSSVCYDETLSDNLIVTNIDKTLILQAFDTISAGLYATIDDLINGKVKSLKTITELDGTRLKDELINKIKFKNDKKSYDMKPDLLDGYQTEIVNRESGCFIIKSIIEIIKGDIVGYIISFPYPHEVMIELVDNLRVYKEQFEYNEFSRELFEASKEDYVVDEKTKERIKNITTIPDYRQFNEDFKNMEDHYNVFRCYVRDKLPKDYHQDYMYFEEQIMRNDYEKLISGYKNTCLDSEKSLS